MAVVTALTVLGGGAEWIWSMAQEQFAGAPQLLDVYHAVEHLAGAGRQAFGEGPGLDDWLERARRSLVGDGYPGWSRRWHGRWKMRRGDGGWTRRRRR
jgi:hypothetical protein